MLASAFPATPLAAPAIIPSTIAQLVPEGYTFTCRAASLTVPLDITPKQLPKPVNHALQTVSTVTATTALCVHQGMFCIKAIVLQFALMQRLSVNLPKFALTALLTASPAKT
jgi:hypothetical protein